MPVQSAHNFSQQDLLLITADPVRYIAKLQGMTGPPLNSCLAPFLRTCLSEHWPLMRDAGIIGLVEKASNSEGLTSMIHALDAYTSCLRFIIYSGGGDVGAERKSVVDIITASKNISSNAWVILKEMYEGPLGVGPREAFRSAIQRVLEHLSLFGDHNHDIANLVSKHASQTSGVSLGELLRSSRWHCLALHSWLYAPDSKSRRDSDATRTCLCDADTRNGHVRQVQFYVKETSPAMLLSQIRPIIQSQDAAEATLAFGLDLLATSLITHHTSVALWDGFEADLCQVIWTIMRSGTTETRRLATARASNLLTLVLAKDPAPMKGPRAFHILHNIVKDHNGARLMARVAVLEATGRPTTHNRQFFLIDHILDMIRTENPPQSEGCRNLIFSTRDMLEPVWLQTNQHLHLLESEQETQAKVILEKWHMLGEAVDVRALANPLIGCSWFMCPLYEEPSAKKMMLCKTCRKVQYCNARCQRGDWKAGHKERCRLVNV